MLCTAGQQTTPAREKRAVWGPRRGRMSLREFKCLRRGHWNYARAFLRHILLFLRHGKRTWCEIGSFSIRLPCFARLDGRDARPHMGSYDL